MTDDVLLWIRKHQWQGRIKRERSWTSPAIQVERIQNRRSPMLRFHSLSRNRLPNHWLRDMQLLISKRRKVEGCPERKATHTKNKEWASHNNSQPQVKFTEGRKKERGVEVSETHKGWLKKQANIFHKAVAAERVRWENKRKKHQPDKQWRKIQPFNRNWATLYLVTVAGLKNPNSQVWSVPNSLWPLRP